jgi:hypothetical protein
MESKFTTGSYLPQNPESAISRDVAFMPWIRAVVVGIVDAIAQAIATGSVRFDSVQTSPRLMCCLSRAAEAWQDIRE